MKKVVKSSLTDKQAIDDLEREVKILTVLKGRSNIVHFYGAYEDEEAVYMVLEYVQIHLSSHNCECAGLPSKQSTCVPFSGTAGAESCFSAC